MYDMFENAARRINELPNGPTTTQGFPVEFFPEFMGAMLDAMFMRVLSDDDPAAAARKLHMPAAAEFLSKNLREDRT